jgi:LysM repeat protein
MRRHSLLTYWRRRVVAASLLMGLLWLIFAGTQFLPGQGKDLQPPAVQTVVESAAGDALAIGRVVIVQPGDTLWSIARGLQPTGDIRPFVDRIAALNGGHSLTAGQTLQLP